MSATLNEIDCIDIVGVDDPRATQPAHDLGENVNGHLAPREVPLEGGHCDRHCGVDVTPGDPSCYPRTQGEADGESKVDRQGVLAKLKLAQFVRGI